MDTNTGNRTYFSGLFAQKKRPKKGLLMFLFTTMSMIFAQEDVEFDFITNKRLVAKAKLREGAPTKNGSEYFKNKKFTPPMYKESRPYNIDQFRKRTAGENVYSDAEVQALIMDKTAEDLAALSDKIDRAVILQFGYILQTGSIPFSTKSLAEDGVIADLDYDCPSAHFVGVTTIWSNAAAVPLTDLEARSVLIQKAYGSAPDTIIMGTTAFQNFMATTQVKNQLDNRKINRGLLGLGGEAPNGMEKDGMNYLGFYIINGKKVGLYSYVDYYIDPSDDATELPVIDADNVVMLNSEARYGTYYAGIPKVIDAPKSMQNFLPDSRITSIGMTQASQEYVRTFTDAKTETVEIELKKAPLVVPIDFNSFGCMDTSTAV